MGRVSWHGQAFEPSAHAVPDSDRVLPLLVNALEHADVDVRRAAVMATKWVNLNGPNVYYNDKLVRTGGACGAVTLLTWQFRLGCWRTSDVGSVQFAST